MEKKKKINLRTQIDLNTHQIREQIRILFEVQKGIQITNEKLEKLITNMAVIALNESGDKCTNLEI